MRVTVRILILRLSRLDEPLLTLILYRYPCFQKVLFMPLCSYERPTLVPVFTNQNKSEDDFCFCQKRQKVKYSAPFLQQALTEAAVTPGSKSGTTSCHSRKLHHHTTRGLNFICDHLCFMFIYFVYLLAKCGLSFHKSLREVTLGVWKCSKNFPDKLVVIVSSLKAISSYKRFCRNATF